MVKISGRKLEVSNQLIVRLSNGADYTFPKSIQGIEMSKGVDPQAYALIQEASTEGNIEDYSANSAISMTQGFNGLNYTDSQVEVLKAGLVIPTPARFMPHLRNANEALKGKGVLYDASGNLIEGDRLKGYLDTLNRNCWVWLNAGFAKGTGFKNLDLMTVSGLVLNEGLHESRVPLEDCLEQDCWADLESLNKQGFPTKKSPIGDKYEPGRTAYFWYPRDGSVARFSAGSNWAGFNCGRYPANRDDALGVFTSTEGASVAKKKDTEESVGVTA